MCMTSMGWWRCTRICSRGSGREAPRHAIGFAGPRRPDAVTACALRPRSRGCAARAVRETGPSCDATVVCLRHRTGASAHFVRLWQHVRRAPHRLSCPMHPGGAKVRTVAKARPQPATAEARSVTNLRRLLPLIALSRPATRRGRPRARLRAAAGRPGTPRVSGRRRGAVARTGGAGAGRSRLCARAPATISAPSAPSPRA